MLEDGRIVMHTLIVKRIELMGSLYRKWVLYTECLPVANKIGATSEFVKWGAAK